MKSRRKHLELSELSQDCWCTFLHHYCPISRKQWQSKKVWLLEEWNCALVSWLLKHAVHIRTTNDKNQSYTPRAQNIYRIDLSGLQSLTLQQLGEKWGQWEYNDMASSGVIKEICSKRKYKRISSKILDIWWHDLLPRFNEQIGE